MYKRRAINREDSEIWNIIFQYLKHFISIDLIIEIYFYRALSLEYRITLDTKNI